jgi:protein-tyrosine phosphatase
MTYRILVVCLANVCRSPLAGAMLTHALERAGHDGHVVVETAGVSAREGAGPCPDLLARARPGQEVASRLLGHTARQLTAADVARADLVLAVDRDVRAAVVRTAPRHQSKVFTLRQVTELAPVARLGSGERSDRELATEPLDALRRWTAGLGMARGQTPPPTAGRRLWPGPVVAPLVGPRVHHHDIPDAHSGGRHAATSRLLVGAVDGVSASFASLLRGA